jgi:hypothetical protein
MASSLAMPYPRDSPKTRNNPLDPRLSPSRVRGRPCRGEPLLRVELREAVGKRERKLLGAELLDVRALDIVFLLDLDNPEDLRYFGQHICDRQR